MEDKHSNIKKLIESANTPPEDKIVNADELRQYLAGGLKSNEQHRLEKKILHDGLANDSLDGLSEINPPQRLSQIELELQSKLNKKLKKRPQLLLKQRTTSWAVAATLLLIAVCAISTIFILQNYNKEKASTMTEVAMSPPQDLPEEAAPHQNPQMRTEPTQEEATKSTNLALNKISPSSPHLENKLPSLSRKTTSLPELSTSPVKNYENEGVNNKAESMKEDASAGISIAEEKAEEKMADDEVSESATVYTDKNLEAKDLASGQTSQNSDARKKSAGKVSNTNAYTDKLALAQQLFDNAQYEKALIALKKTNISKKSTDYVDFLWLRANTNLKLNNLTESKKDLAILASGQSQHRAAASSLLKALK